MVSDALDWERPAPKIVDPELRAAIQRLENGLKKMKPDPFFNRKQEEANDQTRTD